VKREENLLLTKKTLLPGEYRRSILIAYYLRNKKTYNALFRDRQKAIRNEN
jgi:hypothetical protein